MRLDRLDEALQTVRDLSVYWVYWGVERCSEDRFRDFEALQIEALRAVGRASSELALAIASDTRRRARPKHFEVGETRYRVTSPEPRSLNTWFGVVRYTRSYARPVDGGVGWCCVAHQRQRSLHPGWHTTLRPGRRQPAGRCPPAAGATSIAVGASCERRPR